MVGKIMKNSALSAKVHAMNAGALSDQDYANLMNMNSVPGIAAYLAENTGYAAAFKNVSPSALHRTQLERILRDCLRTDIGRMTPFMSSGAKKFMEILFLGEGFERIKICLRLIHIGHPEQIAEYMTKIRGEHVIVPSSVLIEIKTVDGFIEALRGTPYHKVLDFFYGREDRQQQLFMETALDAYWANLLFKYANKFLEPEEIKDVLRLYGIEFDLENLTFLLRCKKTFDLTDEEMYSCIIPSYYMLKKETVARIVKAGSYDDAVSIISDETPYKEAFSKDDRFIEKRRDEYLAKIQRNISRKGQYSVLSPICFVLRRKTEINNIVSIIEGIRYGLQPDVIKTYLVGYGRTGGPQP